MKRQIENIQLVLETKYSHAKKLEEEKFSKNR